MIGIDDAIAAVANLADNAIKRIFPDATEIEKAKLSQLTTEFQNAFQLQLEQIKTNQLEAQSTSLFVSGWRPAVGWIGVTALGWVFIGYPAAEWVTAIWYPTITPPKLITDGLFELVLGMLGLGSMRTIERLNDKIPKGR
jgi:hypothetical protein